jgi:hypothetical protein
MNRIVSNFLILIAMNYYAESKFIAVDFAPQASIPGEVVSDGQPTANLNKRFYRYKFDKH